MEGMCLTRIPPPRNMDDEDDEEVDDEEGSVARRLKMACSGTACFHATRKADVKPVDE